MHLTASPLFLSVIFPFTASCSTAGYLIKQIPGQLDLISNRKEIDVLIDDENTPSELRKTLSLARLAKQFAEEKVGLKKSQNYTVYKDLKRDYVVVSVTAAPKLKLEAHTWSFPFFGSFPYLGFFDRGDAEKEAARLRAEGLDTSVRDVTAYSTLGWFRDAILNTMTKDPATLSETIIHELTHVTVYHKNQGTFNESLASIVGFEGAVLFFESLDETEWPHKKAWVTQMRSRVQRQIEVKKWALTANEKLSALYHSALSDEVKLQKREEIFAELNQLWLKKVSSRALPEMNNATVVAFGTYSDLQDRLMKKFEELGRSLPAFLKWAQNPEAPSQL